MPPYFQRESVKSFADVTITDAGVNTVEFLKAAEGVVGIFGILNSSLLNPVSSDLSGNITKVRTRYNQTPDKSDTLENLVRNEIAEKKKDATQGLLWLIRGLSFTCKAIQQTQADSAKQLSAAFNESYANTLKPHHSFIVRPIFSAAMSACPKREVLYDGLRKKEEHDEGEDATQEELDTMLNAWLDALAKIVARIEAFFEENNYKKGL